MGYSNQIFKGVGWMGLLRASLRGLTFLRIALLARLLTPEQFGLFGIASLILAFLEILTETGINVFLIQGEGKLKNFLNTAFVVSIIRGFVIALVLIILAPFISLFFKSPESKNLIYLISVIPLIRGFINPSIVKFQKDLKFNKEFLFRFSVFLFDSSVAILTAFVFKTPASLVYGMIAGVILEVFLTQRFISPKPRFAFEKEKIKKLLSRGKWITASGVLSYLFTHIDDLIVGKLLGPSSLGIYQMAYKISELPITEVSDVFHKVTFPVFVRIKEDKPRLRTAFVKSLLMVSLIALIFASALLVFTNQFVLLVLGENWLSTVKVLKILVLAGLVRAALGQAPALFLAVRKQEYVTYTTLVGVFVILIVIFPLIGLFGIVGAGVSVLLGCLLSSPLIIFYVFKILKVGNEK